ncbi:MAG TPA: TIGR03617 family F420-dependent LLM class oxidoreductase [Acidimicrobiales bacterium]|nr:TIGR03617 family F420-dependent LLM class oxidoreductase [Acidimicrobiales bacterium]
MKLVTGVGGWPKGVPEAAQRAEEGGFDVVTCGELAHDSMLTMALAATTTERVELQTSVTIAFPRSPMVLAMEAWDIQHLSGGRFSLGLGSQVKGHNERRFGGTWSAPAPRMAEYIDMLRAIWDSWQHRTPPKFVGQQYQYTLMSPNFDPGPLDVPVPKVGLAMVGPGMARVGGAKADVIMPHGGIMSDRYMREVLLPAVGEGLARSGRTWSDIEVAASGYLVLYDDEREIEEKLLGMRRTLSFYGSTRTYHKVLELHGLEELGQKLHALSVQGRWADMEEAVPIEAIAELAQTCRYDDLPDFLATHREYASRLSIAIPATTPVEKERAAELRRQVRALETPGVPRGMDGDAAHPPGS